MGKGTLAEKSVVLAIQSSDVWVAHHCATNLVQIPGE